MANAATPFVSEIVDMASVTNRTSLALDTANEPHIAYIDNTNGGLHYATRRAGTWIVETVDTVGADPSLALDVYGQPRISYWDTVNEDLKYAEKRGGVWVIEVVDNGGNVGSYGSLAVDAMGIPHISYHDATNGDLKHATRNGGVWTLETVDATGDVGEFTSLALDATGNPRISYHDGSNFDLKYAWRNRGFWYVETVESTGLLGAGTSLGLDRQGNPAIAYRDATNGDLKYATRVGTQWQIETVDAVGNVGNDPSLALDVHGNPRISYRDVSNTTLKYASKEAGAWTVETVDTEGIVGSGSSLALDALDNPCIAYYQVSYSLMFLDSSLYLETPCGGEGWSAGSSQLVRWRGAGVVSIELSADGGASYVPLRTGVTANVVSVTVPQVTTDHARVRIVRESPYSTSESAGNFSIAPGLVSPWWTERVEGLGWASEYVSLALDGSGEPHVSYFEGSGSDLRYAFRDVTSWVSQEVDATGFVGQHNALAVDAAGVPHISYRDEDANSLNYAVRPGGEWLLETVEGAGAGYYTSLAVDTGGNPRISYYNTGSGDLRYAEKNGGAWTLSTAVSSGNVGQYTSLALDAEGDPHISFQDVTNQALGYVTRVDGVWKAEMVDAGTYVGFYTSLALDGWGNPHISYLDGTTNDLRYATKRDGVWRVAVVDAEGDVGYQSSIGVTADGEVWISYYDWRDAEGGNRQDLKVARKRGDAWHLESVDVDERTGEGSSLVLDAEGNPHVVYLQSSAGDNLRYASAGLRVVEPADGDTWPVGGLRTVRWNGTGRVKMSLSVDGGSTWQPVAAGVSGGSYGVQMPHLPTHFARLKLERAVPPAEAVSVGLFTIEASIALLNLKAERVDRGGVLLSWETDPGPEDLAGYKVERSPAGGDTWKVVASLVRETRYLDADGASGMRYRLTAINNLWEELLLGETVLTPRAALAAWPLPYRGGELTVSFLTASGLGGGNGSATVAVYDLQGRLVRTLVDASFPAGYKTATWDGRDASGRDVSSGVYFLRATSAGESNQIKLLVVR